MTAAYVVTGTLTDGKIVTLDDTIPLDTRRVRVTVEVLPADTPLDLDRFLNELKQRQQARGHVPLTREEIDEFINEERAGWDHRP